MIIMVTGGQRSGKSKFAENLALSKSQTPVYIATARIFDEDFRHRVEIHKERRGRRWTTFEVPLEVDKIMLSREDVVVFDCVTLWATNWFFECKEDVSSAFEEMKARLDILLASEATFIMVTNEIGLGGTSENAMQRKFTDLQGSINQHIASLADEVYMIVSGIEVKIKGCLNDKF